MYQVKETDIVLLLNQGDRNGLENKFKVIQQRLKQGKRICARRFYSLFKYQGTVVKI